MKVSVIIPAYNEEKTIGRCLTSLLEGSNTDNIQIIVVCNGCSDKTAEKARLFEPKVEVLDIETGSKTLALNMGDSLASYFPRFYIDADIIVSQKSLWKVAEVLESGEFLAAAPKMKIDLDKVSFAVKSYYKIWLKTPYTYQGMPGGIYGLTAAGRERFGDFPDIISDDGFVRLQFDFSERKTVEEVELGWLEYERVGAHMHWCWYQHKDIRMSPGCLQEVRDKQKMLLKESHHNSKGDSSD